MKNKLLSTKNKKTKFGTLNRSVNHSGHWVTAKRTASCPRLPQIVMVKRGYMPNGARRVSIEPSRRKGCMRLPLTGKVRAAAQSASASSSEPQKSRRAVLPRDNMATRPSYNGPSLWGPGRDAQRGKCTRSHVRLGRLVLPGPKQTVTARDCRP